MAIKPFGFILLFSLSFFPLITSALPRQIPPPGEKLVLVDPRENTWGAYNANGMLIRSGLASAGSNWCEDVGRPCRTWVGKFRIRSLGGSNCKSPSFPLPTGGAPMPYCMYFNPYQALHGSNHLANANISHGCVRLRVSDARWLRYHFVNIGTLVIINSY